MRSKLLTLLLLLLPICLFAQNYEKEGDDLFTQAQYEQAEKKYKAAIAILGESQTIKQKQDKCVKCKNLLTKAQTAEKESRYSDAAKHYSDLYAIHALPKYQSKVNAMKPKVQQEELADRERPAKIKAERRAGQDGEWIRVSSLRTTYDSDRRRMFPRNIEFNKMRVSFSKVSSPQYCYIRICYSDTKGVALEFAFQSTPRYYINGKLQPDSFVSRGRRIKDQVYEYDLNELCGTRNKNFIIESWQENFVPEQVEILAKNQ